VSENPDEKMQKISCELSCIGSGKRTGCNKQAENTEELTEQQQAEIAR